MCRQLFQNKGNLSNLLENKNFELMRHDVTFPLYVEVDQIFNLACPASPIHYQSDPVKQQRPASMEQSIYLASPKELSQNSASEHKRSIW